MKVTTEDLRELMRKLDIEIKGLKNERISHMDRVNITTLGLISLKHHIENNIHRVRN